MHKAHVEPNREHGEADVLCNMVDDRRGLAERSPAPKPDSSLAEQGERLKMPSLGRKSFPYPC